MKAKKIIVIGCPGSGKSHFSRALAELSGLPLYHLDMLYWKPDRTTVSKEDFREKLSSVLSKAEWIIDGNYGSTIEMRLAACDLVFFLDLPTDVCISGIKERFGKPRSDIPWIETEEDPEFIEFINSFNIESRPKILDLFKKYPQKKVVTFHSRSEADQYLNTLKERP